MASSSWLLLLFLTLIFPGKCFVFPDESMEYEEDGDYISHEAKFNCSNGQIILWKHHCDNKKDCQDGSDEIHCPDPSMLLPGHFKCNNHPDLPIEQSIPGSWRCDGEPDCPDGSDELNCNHTVTSSTTVSPSSNTTFTCSDGSKIPILWRCDEDFDCADRGDEQNCLPENIDNLFQCSDGKKIRLAWRCDGKKDCDDGIDEENCDSGLFKCKNNRTIRDVWRCNHEDDCGDGSDEEKCGCTAFQFECRDGKCIDLFNLCDGERDCNDGSDEMKCGKGPSFPLRFRCDNGRTIWNDWRCDNVNNCGDGSDERNCTEGRCNTMQYRCGNGKCLNGWRVCDGRRDCPDGSDEVPCSRFRERKQCPSWLFRCKNQHHCILGERRCLTQTFCSDKSDVHGCKTKNTEGKCDSTHVHWHRYPCATTGCYELGDICDGKNTCNDTFSDELNCGYWRCGDNEFRCDNGMCLDKSTQCDGHRDCGDGSDEWSCPAPAVPCKPCEFQCGNNGRCVPIHMVCDGFLQCADASDEWDCGNHNVSQNCLTFFPPNLLPLTKLPPITTTTTTTPLTRVVTRIIFGPTRPPKDCKNDTENVEQSAHTASTLNQEKYESSSVSSLSVAVCVLTFLLLALALVVVIGGRYILNQSGQSDRQVLYLRSSSPP